MVQEIIIYALLGAAVLFLGVKYLGTKKKDQHDKNCDCG